MLSFHKNFFNEKCFPFTATNFLSLEMIYFHSKWFPFKDNYFLLQTLLSFSGNYFFSQELFHITGNYFLYSFPFARNYIPLQDAFPSAAIYFNLQEVISLNIPRASKSGINVRDPNFRTKMSRLYIQPKKTGFGYKWWTITYLHAL